MYGRCSFCSASFVFHAPMLLLTDSLHIRPCPLDTCSYNAVMIIIISVLQLSYELAVIVDSFPFSLCQCEHLFRVEIITLVLLTFVSKQIAQHLHDSRVFTTHCPSSGSE